MLRRITKIVFATVLLLFLFGACRTKKIIGSGVDLKIDTVEVAIVPIDTIKYAPEQTPVYVAPVMTILDYYNNAYNEIEQMLRGYKPLDFKRGVFVTENAFYNEGLNYKEFCTKINLLTERVNNWKLFAKLNNYKANDSNMVKTNFAIYSLMCDTLLYSINGLRIPSYPYRYDFDDFFGQKEWSQMFVTKLIDTKSGNCHSMPYLYKILANEFNVQAYLSLAPNHLYVKHKCRGFGWYNTELTSGEFPTDAWIKTSGYITLDAIRSGIFMDTLGQVESVALCAYDLAQGYLAKTNNFLDGFAIKCCNLALRYHPTNVNAMILKAEILRKQFDNAVKLNQTERAYILKKEMEKYYLLVLKSGYREMPKQMYLAWLKSVSEQSDKYTNSQIYKLKSK